MPEHEPGLYVCMAPFEFFEWNFWCELFSHHPGQHEHTIHSTDEEKKDAVICWPGTIRTTP